MKYLAKVKEFTGTETAKLSLIDRFIKEDLSEEEYLELSMEQLKIYSRNDQPVKTRAILDEVLPLIRKYKSKIKIAQALYVYSTILYYNFREYEQCVPILQEVITLLTTSSERDEKTIEHIADSYSFLGALSYFFKFGGSTEIAFKNFKLALSNYVEINNHQGISVIYNNIGNIYQLEKKYEKAIEQYRLAIEHLEMDRSYLWYNHVLAQHLCEIISCFVALNELETAASFLEKVVALEAGVPAHIISFIQYTKALLLTRQGKYEAALVIFKNFETTEDRLNINSNLIRGDIYFEQDEFDTAIKYYKAALELSFKSKMRCRAEEDIYDKLVASYEKINNLQACVNLLKEKAAFIKEEKDREQLQLSLQLKYEFDTQLKDQELMFKTELLEAKDALNKQLELSNKELNTFAHRIAHDLKEPIRMIDSYSKLLERLIDSEDERIHEFLSYLTSSSQKMYKMIAALLDFASIGKNTTEMALVNLESIIDDAVDNLAFQFQNGNIVFTKDALPAFEGHETLLLMLFQNIIANAIKFKREDITKIHVSHKERETEYAIAVTDNGIGMRPEDKDRVFDMFSRLNARDKFEGLGVGLATCKRIMEIHKGYIEIESELGVGTSFILVFPKSVAV